MLDEPHPLTEGRPHGQPVSKNLWKVGNWSIFSPPAQAGYAASLGHPCLHPPQFRKLPKKLHFFSRRHS